jgi:diguanylate cyclase (GGDEF)-like protein
MNRQKILIVDDEPDIVDVLEITLASENYETLKAFDGEQAMRIIMTKPLDLVLLDYNMPKMNGPQVCKAVKNDTLLAHLPIIMLTGKGDITDKVGGIEAGADDYIVKPFEPKELLARIRMVLRRTERDLEANPLTKLPGNVSILNILSSKIENGAPFSVCYIDLNKFKAYNDKYGFEHGDEVLRQTARILIETVKTFGNNGDFIGHIGGDDFVIVTTPERADLICKKIIEDFEKSVPTFYSETDLKNKYIIGLDRKGAEQKFPLLSISIGVVSNETRKIEHVAQIGEIGAELKSFAKRLEQSNFVKDKRA